MPDSKIFELFYVFHNIKLKKFKIGYQAWDKWDIILLYLIGLVVWQIFMFRYIY